jgi:hypothetical protein
MLKLLVEHMVVLDSGATGIRLHAILHSSHIYEFLGLKYCVTMMRDDI